MSHYVKLKIIVEAMKDNNDEQYTKLSTLDNFQDFWSKWQ